MTRRILLRPALPHDAPRVHAHLSREDLLECEAWGADPLASLTTACQPAFIDWTWALCDSQSGEPMAMGGIFPAMIGVGVPWMLGSLDAPLPDRIWFVRRVRAEIAHYQTMMPFLMNRTIDTPLRVRLLRDLGFDMGQPFRHSAGVSFRYFWKGARPTASSAAP